MEISVLTLNCKLLPFYVVEKNTKRVQRLISAIEECKADIIFLQETFSYTYAHLVIKKLKSNGYFVSSESMYFPKMGGLLIAARFPLREPRFQKFMRHSTAWSENLIWKKGLKSAICATPLGDVVLVNTHLAHRTHDIDVRIEQLKQILATVPSEKTVIFAGDFNMTKSAAGSLSKEFQLISEAGFEDSLLGSEEDYATFCVANILTPRNLDGLGKDSRLDFIFIRQHQKIFRVAQSQLIGTRGDPISDHYGYMITLEPVVL